MNSKLPLALQRASAELLEGVSRKDLAARSKAISSHYRSGKGSNEAVAGSADALAYLIARLPATYAVVAAVLRDVNDAYPSFAPRSLLDAGAGPGSASWAAVEAYDGLQDITLLDSNPSFLDLAERLARHTRLADAKRTAQNLLSGNLPSADLVIASFVLAEVDANALLIDRLYAAATDVLVLVEPGTPAGFLRIRAARDRLNEQKAQILGPCTHTEACPLVAPDWCHFSQRLARSRDQMLAKNARVPFEDERYCWIAVSRGRPSNTIGKARVLAEPVRSKAAITLKLCVAGGLEQRVVPKRDRQAYSTVRRKVWGDLL